ncbi:CBS domain protein [Halanaerobium saccharolyticum]|uniref:CBS domain protein n=1 Tax=Halanaerobium saccharolyticum TaxID=43595 RepID=A0A4R6RPS8_9FIRM|nr:CBS domain-containing protein [Halanaerobium saccharolyticum]TDP88690.1 CBS domain protein [Halanaerobium saccharolyticum]
MEAKKDKFIEMFNELYEHLKEVNDWDTSFYSLLHEGRNNDYIIRKYKDELDTVREVRNSIAHNNEYYFLPSSSLYTLLEEILEKVIDSPKISDFIDDNLMVIKEDTSIIKTIQDMKKHDYDQIPVVDQKGKYIELLTTNTIIRWMGDLKSAQSAKLIIEDVQIKEVLNYAEEDEVCEFISKNSKLDTLIDKHESIIKAGNKIDAFLITENGSREEVLQGIITDWEIPEIYNKLNI